MSPLQSRKGQRTPTIRATLSCITQFIFSPSRYTMWFQNLNRDLHPQFVLVGAFRTSPATPQQQFRPAGHHRHGLVLATPLTVSSPSNHGLEFRHEEITGPEDLRLCKSKALTSLAPTLKAHKIGSTGTNPNPSCVTPGPERSRSDVWGSPPRTRACPVGQNFPRPKPRAPRGPAGNPAGVPGRVAPPPPPAAPLSPRQEGPRVPARRGRESPAAGPTHRAPPGRLSAAARAGAASPPSPPGSSPGPATQTCSWCGRPARGPGAPWRERGGGAGSGSLRVPSPGRAAFPAAATATAPPYCRRHVTRAGTRPPAGR